MAVQVELKRIVITENAPYQVIVLKETEGNRSFPILIGANEADAIDRRLKGRAHIRPQTHDLLSDVIEKLEGKLERILIYDLKILAGTEKPAFLARIILRQAGGKTVEVESRPSDAIALGVANNVPIFVSEHVFDEVES